MRHGLVISFICGVILDWSNCGSITSEGIGFIIGILVGVYLIPGIEYFWKLR